MRTRLDKKTAAALTLPDGKTEDIHWDDQLDRFGLRLRRSGGRVLRSWIVQYRRAGMTRRMTIGSDALTLEQARLAGRKALAMVDLGEDPQADRGERRDKDKLSFRSVAVDYIKARQNEVRPVTLQHITGYLQRGDYFKTLHTMPLDRITRKDVANQLIKITELSGRPAAGQARATLSAFFAWCIKMGLTDSNPVIGTAQPRANPPRDRILSDTELAAIWTAADGNDDFSRIVRLLILLPCRRQEVGGMAWSEIDLDAAAWTVPADRAKNGRAITLPCTASALRIISSVPRRVECDHLFGQHGFTSWHRAKKALDAKLDIPSWNLHDLRRTCATRLADLGVAPHVIEQILNHQSGHRAGVAGIYNRSKYEREVKAAVAMWDRHITASIEGREQGNVVPIRATVDKPLG
jgi:integrase